MSDVRDTSSGGPYDPDSMLGQGIYTYQEAARLSGIPAPRLRRWLEGYHYTDGSGAHRHSRPVIEASVRRVDEVPTISFNDLLEAMFVERFLREGVSMPTIRRAAEQATADMAAPYPFLVKRFRTDGRTIFIEVAKEQGDERLLDVVKRQAVFRDVIEPLLSNVHYDVSTGLATSWSPMGKASPVLVDPARSFGKPIVRDSGVPTSILAAAVVRGTETVESIARWYGVPAGDVRAAVEFEVSGRAAA